jgi:MFS transporter, SP family, general alpha glucoside:H+ symporter
MRIKIEWISGRGEPRRPCSGYFQLVPPFRSFRQQTDLV